MAVPRRVLPHRAGHAGRDRRRHPPRGVGRCGARQPGAAVDRPPVVRDLPLPLADLPDHPWGRRPSVDGRRVRARTGAHRGDRGRVVPLRRDADPAAPRRALVAAAAGAARSRAAPDHRRRRCRRASPCRCSPPPTWRPPSSSRTRSPSRSRRAAKPSPTCSTRPRRRRSRRRPAHGPGAPTHRRPRPRVRPCPACDGRAGADDRGPDHRPADDGSPDHHRAARAVPDPRHRRLGDARRGRGAGRRGRHRRRQGQPADGGRDPQRPGPARTGSPRRCGDRPPRDQRTDQPGDGRQLLRASCATCARSSCSRSARPESRGSGPTTRSCLVSRDASPTSRWSTGPSSRPAAPATASTRRHPPEARRSALLHRGHHVLPRSLTRLPTLGAREHACLRHVVAGSGRRHRGRRPDRLQPAVPHRLGLDARPRHAGHAPAARDHARPRRAGGGADGARRLRLPAAPRRRVHRRRRHRVR